MLGLRSLGFALAARHLVGPTCKRTDGQLVCGVYYATSENLTAWTEEKLLWQTPLANQMDPDRPWRAGDPAPVWYPALLDPKSQSPNFETTGKRAYIYAARWSDFRGAIGGSGPERDLIRIAVEFSE
jgi:hypothetical protein